MNKAELIEEMSKSTKMPKVICKKLLESLIGTVEKALKKKKSVVLTNFGTFMVVSRKGRMGVNPSTGAKMKINPKSVVKFKVGKKLKALIN